TPCCSTRARPMLRRRPSAARGTSTTGASARRSLPMQPSRCGWLADCARGTRRKRSPTSHPSASISARECRATDASIPRNSLRSRGPCAAPTESRSCLARGLLAPPQQHVRIGEERQALLHRLRLILQQLAQSARVIDRAPQPLGVVLARLVDDLLEVGEPVL